MCIYGMIWLTKYITNFINLFILECQNFQQFQTRITEIRHSEKYLLERAIGIELYIKKIYFSIFRKIIMLINILINWQNYNNKYFQKYSCVSWLVQRQKIKGVHITISAHDVYGCFSERVETRRRLNMNISVESTFYTYAINHKTNTNLAQFKQHLCTQ